MTRLDRAIVYLIEKFHLEDKVYDVRERIEHVPEGMSSWDHPDVAEFSRHVKVLKDHAKKART